MNCENQRGRKISLANLWTGLSFLTMHIHWVQLKNIGNFHLEMSLKRLPLVYCGQAMNTKQRDWVEHSQKRKRKMESKVKISIQDELRFITAAFFQFCSCYFASALNLKHLIFLLVRHPETRPQEWKTFFGWFLILDVNGSLGYWALSYNFKSFFKT